MNELAIALALSGILALFVASFLYMVIGGFGYDNKRASQSGAILGVVGVLALFAAIWVGVLL